MKHCKEMLRDHIVTLFFLLICLAAIVLSQQPVAFILRELMIRISRNAVLIVSLIIPIMAGLGLNFSIVLGAMAGQVALICITHWHIVGLAGMLVCVAISTPLAIIFGYFTGALLNKTKGQEMITGMILAFFASGVYELIFLIMVGTIIPMHDPNLVLSSGVGLKNTIELQEKTKYALDKLLQIQLNDFVIAAYLIFIVYVVFTFGYPVYRKIKGLQSEWLTNKTKKTGVYFIILTLVFSICVYNKALNFAMKFINIPVVTMFVIFLVCMLTLFITRTKLGQDFRTVGQSMHVANSSGLEVNSLRIMAIIISTVLAAWGQVMFIQNMGTFNTYSSHEQVGMFSIAALLIGGASVTKATISQALIGLVLFHTLFIVSPMAGKNLFNNAQIGEYFRVFIAYGVIGISLGLHAWKKTQNQKRSLNA